jgi:hypothetical protein
MNNLGFSYAVLGRHVDALKLHEEARALATVKLGPEHPVTLLNMLNIAENYAALGRHADALPLLEQTLALLKAKLGPDHYVTLEAMWGVATVLLVQDRGAQAEPIVDEWIRRTAGKYVDIREMARILDTSCLRHLEKRRSAAGCRATAGMWEKLSRTDGDFLYNAARYRAVTAAVIRGTGLQSVQRAQEAAAEADRAMAWLKQAVAVGYKDAAHMKQDPDLDPLRGREDFQKLIAELELKTKEKTNAASKTGGSR